MAAPQYNQPANQLMNVDEAAERLTDGQDERTQGGQTDQEPVGRIADLHSERCAQCVPLQLVGGYVVRLRFLRPVASRFTPSAS